MSTAIQKQAAGASSQDAAAVDAARRRLAETGRNDVCPCGSGKKYKKCCLRADEALAVEPEAPPSAKELAMQGWRLIEQRRPGAAEKQFRAALEVDPAHLDARVGVGMARLSAGDRPEALALLGEVVTAERPRVEALRAEGVTNAFERPEAQPLVRAAYALGCMQFDDGEHAACADTLALVHAIDAGAIGTEARLVAGKALVKAGRAADALAVLQPAAQFAQAAARAEMGLALAHFVAGAPGEAEAALARALQRNPHLGKAVLGQLRVQVDNPAAALPGSREEAAFYAQGFGDAWDEGARAFLGEALARRATARAPGAGVEPEATPAT